jgi:hypothetical protein
MKIKTKFLLWLTLLAIVDTIVPFPIVGVILIYVLLQNPPWFRNVVTEIYAED